MKELFVLLEGFFSVKKSLAIHCMLSIHAGRWNFQHSLDSKVMAFHYPVIMKQRISYQVLKLSRPCHLGVISSLSWGRIYKLQRKCWGLGLWSLNADKWLNDHHYSLLADKLGMNDQVFLGSKKEARLMPYHHTPYFCIVNCPLKANYHKISSAE